MSDALSSSRWRLRRPRRVPSVARDRRHLELVTDRRSAALADVVVPPARASDPDGGRRATVKRPFPPDRRSCSVPVTGRPERGESRREDASEHSRAHEPTLEDECPLKGG